jgi:hypothetical protein
MRSLRLPLSMLGLPMTLALACSLTPVVGSDPDVPEGVLFQDDFSDSSSGWDSVRTDEGMTDYDGGVYRIVVNQTQTDYWGNPGRDFVDVRVEADASKGGGPDDNDYGLICRYRDTKNFYAFLISSDGFYAITKVVNGDYELIGLDAMQPSDSIQQGGATNRIRGDCVGTTLTLYVNGDQLYSVEDASYASGDVGLIAGTFDETGADIRFDNFSVREP